MVKIYTKNTEIFFSNPPPQLLWYLSQGESQKFNLMKCHIGLYSQHRVKIRSSDFAYFFYDFLVHYLEGFLYYKFITRVTSSRR